jgi:hypothetical protein
VNGWAIQRLGNSTAGQFNGWAIQWLGNWLGNSGFKNKSRLDN